MSCPIHERCSPNWPNPIGLASLAPACRSTPVLPRLAAPLMRAIMPATVRMPSRMPMGGNVTSEIRLVNAPNSTSMNNVRLMRRET